METLITNKGKIQKKELHLARNTKIGTLENYISRCKMLNTAKCPEHIVDFIYSLNNTPLVFIYLIMIILCLEATPSVLSFS